MSDLAERTALCTTLRVAPSPPEVANVTQEVTPAYVLAPVENDAQRELREGLALLGPNGENWVRGSCITMKSPITYDEISPENCKMCIGTAVRFGAVKRGWRQKFRDVLGQVWGIDNKERASLRALTTAAWNRGAISYEVYNDCRADNFSDIQSLVADAIEIAGRQNV